MWKKKVTFYEKEMCVLHKLLEGGKIWKNAELKLDLMI